MTVNELIDVLKGSGDDGFRDMAKVRLVDMNGSCIEDNLNPFDVKVGLFTVDIPVDVRIAV